MHRARYPGVALYHRFVSLLPVPQTTPLECPIIQVSLVFIANPYHPRRKSPAGLTKPVIPDYGFALAGGCLLGRRTQREGDDVRAQDLLPDSHRAGASRSREGAIRSGGHGGAPSADRACQP
jgi:hypothetical protein